MLAATSRSWRDRSRKLALTLALGASLGAMPTEHAFAFQVLEPMAPTSYEECHALHQQFHRAWRSAHEGYQQCIQPYWARGQLRQGHASNCRLSDGNDSWVYHTDCISFRERTCEISIAQREANQRCRAKVERYQAARREQERRENAARLEMSQRPRVVAITPRTMTPDAEDRIGRPERQPAFASGGQVGSPAGGGGGQAFSLPGLVGFGMQTGQSSQSLAPLFGRLGGAAGAGSAAHMFLTAQTQADRLRAVGSGMWGLGAVGMPGPPGLAFGLGQALIVETALGASGQLQGAFRTFDSVRSPVSAAVMWQFESSSLGSEQAFQQQSAAALGLPLDDAPDDPFGNILQATMQVMMSVLQRHQARQLEASQAVARADAAARAAAEQRRQQEIAAADARRREADRAAEQRRQDQLVADRAAAQQAELQARIREAEIRRMERQERQWEERQRASSVDPILQGLGAFAAGMAAGAARGSFVPPPPAPMPSHRFAPGGGSQFRPDLAPSGGARRGGECGPSDPSTGCR